MWNISKDLKILFILTNDDSPFEDVAACIVVPIGWMAVKVIQFLEQMEAKTIGNTPAEWKCGICIHLAEEPTLGGEE
jgi:hypothetical protein